MDVTTSGIPELDTITGVGGFPHGSVAELSGLSDVQIGSLAKRISQASSHATLFRLHTPDQIAWLQLEKLLTTGSGALTILATDGPSADWIRDPDRVSRIRGLATEYRTVVFIAIPALIRVTSLTEQLPLGLAAAAGIRIRLSQEQGQEGQIVAQVIKNRFAEPYSRATIDLPTV